MDKLFQPLPWVHTTNVYEVNVRQYSAAGNFKGFASSLPRLRDMGVDTLWFMPITPISLEKRQGSLGSYYAASRYDMTNPEFGTVDEFKELVDAAHALGMKVIIDWVANHTGWDHEWVKVHPEYYKRNEHGEFYDPHGWTDVIDLNYDNQEMREAMFESMAFWVQHCDVDGFRCDMAMLVPLDFWAQARGALDAIKPLFWMAELDQLGNPEYLQVFDAAYTWTWMHDSQEFYQRHLGLDTLEEVLMSYDHQPPKDSIRIWFTSNHDENTWNGTEYDKYGDMALSLAVFSATWNGIPMVYSGQELPNRSRLPFFDRGPIQWGDKTPALHGFYKTLLTLHSTHPALSGGDPEVTTFKLGTTADDKIFAFLRKRIRMDSLGSADPFTAPGREVLVFLNWSGDSVNFRLQDQRLQGTYQEVFHGHDVVIDSSFNWTLHPWEYLVLQR
jgi:alpha-amylase